VGHSRLVGEDHLVWLGVLRVAGKRLVDLGTVCVANLEVTGDLRPIECGHRNGERHRDRVAEIDERMDLRQCTFLPESPQECLRGASVLRGLEPHLRVRAPPRLDLGLLALDVGFETRFRLHEEAGGSLLDIDGSGDLTHGEHARNQLWEVVPDLARVRELHVTPPELVGYVPEP
jgi:hypothetical protein